MDTKNDILWDLAKRRAAFKKRLTCYIIVNAFLWAVWFVAGRWYEREAYFPWPVWVMLAWGVCLAFNYVNAYMVNTHNAVEQEYEKLKKQQ